MKATMYNQAGKEIASKTIKSSSNTNAAMGGGQYQASANVAKMHDIYGTAVNQCLNKAVIMMDRFINTHM